MLYQVRGDISMSLTISMEISIFREVFSNQLFLGNSMKIHYSGIGVGQFSEVKDVCKQTSTNPNGAFAAHHCFTNIKNIENGHRKSIDGKVWPSDKEILDFIKVVAGSYLLYEKTSESDFEIQVII